MIEQPDNLDVRFADALLWQHEEAEGVKGLVAQKQAFYDTYNKGFWTDWRRDVLNLDTANEFGISVWAIILNFPLGKSSKARLPISYFGFGGGRNNFNGNFSDAPTFGLAELNLGQRRTILKLRYGQITTRCDILGVNKMLARVFNGSIYMLQTTDMSFAVYGISATIPAKMLQVIQDYDLLPRPAGVGVRFVDLANRAFGFGASRNNFNGNFAE